MTTHATIAMTAPRFDGLPRRKLAWSWATLALWVLLSGGFVASVAVRPDAPLRGEVAASGAAGGAVVEVPCPPTCSPAHG